MPSIPESLHAPLAAAIALAVTLPGLGASGLLDPWEMDRAATARRVAGAPQVMVVDEDGELLARLDHEVGGELGLRRADGGAALALARLDGPLGRRVHHAVIIDADAVLRARKGPRGEDLLAGRIDSIRSHNRGTLVMAVTAGPPERLRRALARGRARILRAAMAGGWWQYAMPPAKEADKLWPLMWQDDPITSPEHAARDLLAACPSPWVLVEHKVDGVSVQAPLLDTWMVALSVRLLGTTEFSVRLPGALCFVALAWMLVAGGSLLFGARTGWLALLVLVSTPMALGSARIVTFEQATPVGALALTLGLALGASNRSRWWWLWLLAGGSVMFLGGGLGSLSVAVVILVGYVLTSHDLRPRILGAALLSLLALGLAARVVLGNDDSALLHTLRFTRVPFEGGLPDARRDFSELVSHLGFGFYPWGPAFLLGCGRLLTARDRPAADSRRDLALLLGFGAPVLGAGVLLPEFQHVTIPVAATVALITATLLADVLDGRVHGAVLALLVFVPALLVDHEVGKKASTLVRSLAFDPPFAAPYGLHRSPYTWPRELPMHRGIRAVTLLLTLGFGLALARPVAALRRLADRFQSLRATTWMLVGVLTVWVLDVLISLGTRLDVLLRTEATRTGYRYDRIWTTVQMTRPEVVAGATLFAFVLAGGILLDLGRARGYGERRVARLLPVVTAPFSMPAVAIAITLAAAVAVFVSGSMVHLEQRHAGWGRALAAGAVSGAFIAPLFVALAGGILTVLSRRARGRRCTPDPTLPASARAPAGRGGVLAIALPLVVAFAGLGIGASQAAGTWSYGFLAACWWLAACVGLVVGGRGGHRAAWAWSGLGIALVVAGNCWSVLAGRLLAEPSGPGMPYLARLLFGSVDTLGLLLVGAAAVLNHLAVRYRAAESLRRLAMAAAGLAERPRSSVMMIGLGALFLGVGYAYGLLPGMSLHFSQKHLLARVRQAGGAVRPGELPRTFKYARHATGIHSNFYTRTMPTITDRDAVLDLLAGRNVGTRLSDYGELGHSFAVAIPGWSDANDRDGDGKRDHRALLAIARKVRGLSLSLRRPPTAGDRAAPLPLRPDAWKGARLLAPHDQVVDILGNTATELRLAAPASVIGGDPSRGLVALDSNPPGFGAPHSSAMTRGARFVVLAKDEFSALNHAFRLRHGGRSIRLLDARSSRLVLAASALSEKTPDENWLSRALYDRGGFDRLEGVIRVSANFDDHLELIGYSLENRAVPRAHKYHLRLYFLVHKPVSTSYKLFMHPHPLHADQWPLAYKPNDKHTEKRCQGCFQTDHWLAGDIVEVPIDQEVPLGTSTGPADIILGWYNPMNDKRLPVVSARGPGVFKHADNRVTIGRLQVR